MIEFHVEEFACFPKWRHLVGSTDFLIFFEQITFKKKWKRGRKPTNKTRDNDDNKEQQEWGKVTRELKFCLQNYEKKCQRERQLFSVSFLFPFFSSFKRNETRVKFLFPTNRMNCIDIKSEVMEGRRLKNQFNSPQFHIKHTCLEKKKSWNRFSNKFAILTNVLSITKNKL